MCGGWRRARLPLVGGLGLAGYFGERVIRCLAPRRAAGVEVGARCKVVDSSACGTRRATERRGTRQGAPRPPFSWLILKLAAQNLLESGRGNANEIPCVSCGSGSSDLCIDVCTSRCTGYLQRLGPLSFGPHTKRQKQDHTKILLLHMSRYMNDPKQHNAWRCGRRRASGTVAAG